MYTVGILGGASLVEQELRVDTQFDDNLNRVYRRFSDIHESAVDEDHFREEVLRLLEEHRCSQREIRRVIARRRARYDALNEEHALSLTTRFWTSKLATFLGVILVGFVAAAINDGIVATGGVDSVSWSLYFETVLSSNWVGAIAASIGAIGITLSFQETIRNNTTVEEVVNHSAANKLNIQSEYSSALLDDLEDANYDLFAIGIPIRRDLEARLAIRPSRADLVRASG